MYHDLNNQSGTEGGGQISVLCNFTNGSFDGQNNGSCLMFDPGYDNPFDYLYVKIIFIFLYSIVFVACFVGNLLVIFVILRHKKMRSITNFFLANLAVADFCVGIFCVIPNLRNQIAASFVLPREMCKVYFFVQAMSYTASVCILTVISVERFFAIIYPIKSIRLTTLCLLRGVIIAVWVISAGSALPHLIYYDTTTIVDDLVVCSPGRNLDEKTYTALNFALWYVIPLLLMIVMYTKISIVLWKSSRPQSLGTRMDRSNPKVNKKPKKKPPKNRAAGGYVAFRKNDGSAEEAVALNPAPTVVVTSCMGSSDEDHGKLPEKNGAQAYEMSRLAPCEEGVGSSDDPSSFGSDEQLPLDYEDDWPSHGKKGSAERIAKTSSKIPKEETTSYTNNSFRPNGSQGGDRMCGTQSPKRTQLPKANNPKVSKRRGKGDINVLVARRRVIRLLIAVIVSFAVCVLPYNLRVLWLTWNPQPAFSFWQKLTPAMTFVLYYFNSALNPILYAFLSDNFRKSLREVLICRTNRRVPGSSFRNTTVSGTGFSKSTGAPV